MAKFNVVQKKRRAIIADRKRATRGDPRTGKLKIKPQPQSISGKRQRKLLKKWRRDQKEAVEKGLVSMEDVEMVAAGGGEGPSKDAANRTPAQFHVKKGLKLKKQLKRSKGKSSKNSKPAAETSVDAMV